MSDVLMPQDPRRRLGRTLAGWMDQRGVGMTHVAKFGGLTVNTVRYILDGTTRRPLETTIPKLARGVATYRNPPHRVDMQDEADCLRDLRAAGGYVTLDEIEADTLLELGLYLRFQDRRTVAAWMAIHARHAELTPDEILRLDVRDATS